MRYGRFALHLTRGIFAVLLVVGLLLITMRPAAAQQSPTCTATSSPIAIPSPISIAPGAPNGKIGSPSPPVTVSVNCLNAYGQTPNYYDNFNVQTGQLAALDFVTAPPGGAGLMFQTNVPGIDVLLTATPNQASSGSNGPNGTAGWSIGIINCNYNSNRLNCSPNPVSATFIAQLVKIGPVSPGQITSINLLQIFETDTVTTPPKNWTGTIYYSSASPQFGTLTLNPVTVSMSTCNVTASSKNISVILPTISTGALQSTGSVAGQTAFNINYSCPAGSAGWALYMTMNTANPGIPSGVVLSPASCASGASATNIGVQLLQSNQQPVQFNVAQPLLGGSLSSNGPLTLTYYAQYYATNSPVGAGPVCSTATFTMSYQ